MQKFHLIFLIGALLGNVQAQVLMDKDSLLKQLPLMQQDTNGVLLYINLGQQYESNDPAKAKYYYRQARNLSQKINYTRGLIKYIVNYTFVLNLQGSYDSSLYLNQQSVLLSRQINDSVYLAKTLFNTGTSYRINGEYENAVRMYEEGKRIFAMVGNPDLEVHSDDILQSLYYELKQYPRAIEYGERAVTGLRRLNDLPSLGTALNNLGLSYASLKNFDKASALFKEALLIARKIDDRNMEQSQYLNLGDVCFQNGDYEGMKPYMDKALLLSKELEIHESELIATKGLSFYYQSKKNYAASQLYGQEALALSYQYNLRIQRQKVLNHLSNLAYSMQDTKLGEYYATQGSLLGDSILNETIQKNALELETKYETEKKENQIMQLKADKEVQRLHIKQKNTLNYILLGSAFTLLLLTLLSYRNYRQQQRIQQQRISELEKEKQLTATEAVLKGEEQERTRLAQDLHDGLGGMLSGIKYAFNSMKENLIMTPENHQAFERSMDMLDSSIKEMRRVAHNMMPETLLKFGLDTGLKDYCADINASGAMEVSYQSIGLAQESLDQTTAITIYRIVQELINNTLKHAAARHSIVQVSKSHNQFSITVEDDGKGFDTVLLRQSKGIGWSNIQHRVDFLKGKLDVISQPGKGTSVHIEFDI